MEIVLYVVVAIASGFIVHMWHKSQKASGTLRIDHRDPNKDRYLFDIDDLDALDNKKRIVLTIDHNAVLSQD